MLKSISPMARQLIAIVGGIGSGKSVVSRILATMGFGVYDTDAAAKRLMNASPQIIKALKTGFGCQVYTPDGVIDRAYLSRIVFADASKLQFLNNVVHPAVVRDVHSWAERCDGDIAFVETALLRTSGLDRVVTGVWRVDAPVETRVLRVMRRNGMPEAAVRSRIVSQRNEELPSAHECVIINDGVAAVLPQVIGLLKKCGIAEG